MLLDHVLDGGSSVSFFPSSLLISICWTAKASVSMLRLLLLLLLLLLYALELVSVTRECVT